MTRATLTLNRAREVMDMSGTRVFGTACSSITLKGNLPRSPILSRWLTHGPLETCVTSLFNGKWIAFILSTHRFLCRCSMGNVASFLSACFLDCCQWTFLIPLVDFTNDLDLHGVSSIRGTSSLVLTLGFSGIRGYHRFCLLSRGKAQNRGLLHGVVCFFLYR